MSLDLTVVVTSGGTICKIDDVRHIGNFSRGTTGALIAEEFLRAGATVHYVHSREARRPFRRGLIVDPSRPVEEEVARIRKAHQEFNAHASRLHEHPIETFDEYHDAVRKLLTEEPVDVIVLAAAVSDYGARPETGKISSDLDTMQLELVRNPKVISLVKKWNPKVFQVGFKLLSGAGLDELVDVAYRSGIKNHSNLTVANTITAGDFRKRVTVLITPEKGLRPVSLPELASTLVGVVQQRISKRHYHTVVARDPEYRSRLEGRLDGFRAQVRKLWQLNLFEPYYEGADMHFGFVAASVAEGGFLITSRGSNKRDMPLDDIVYVPRVDFDSRTVHVNSAGKKASLNANVAARIFEDRPDVNVILHAHVFPGVENRTSIDYAPGTQEDVDEVAARLRAGESIVELVNHGIIAVGAGLDGVVSALDVEPAYTKFPELYDAVYARFQRSPEFVDLVSREVSREESILDLAGGTGDVSRQLLEKGHKAVSVADKNEEMLRVARAKLSKEVPTYVTLMQDVDIDATFDAIVVRQAINYLMTLEGLVTGLKAIQRRLNPGGRLIFNAPNYTGNSTYGDRDFDYEAGNYHVKVEEMNLVEGRIITHTQRCVLTKTDGSGIKKLYDLNRFGLFTKDEFGRALREAGFASVRFLGKGLTEYSSASRSLYCVASK